MSAAARFASLRRARRRAGRAGGPRGRARRARAPDAGSPARSSRCAGPGSEGTRPDRDRAPAARDRRGAGAVRRRAVDRRPRACAARWPSPGPPRPAGRSRGARAGYRRAVERGLPEVAVAVADALDVGALAARGAAPRPRPRSRARRRASWRGCAPSSRSGRPTRVALEAAAPPRRLARASTRSPPRCSPSSSPAATWRPCCVASPRRRRIATEPTPTRARRPPRRASPGCSWSRCRSAPALLAELLEPGFVGGLLGSTRPRRRCSAAPPGSRSRASRDPAPEPGGRRDERAARRRSRCCSPSPRPGSSAALCDGRLGRAASVALRRPDRRPRRSAAQSCGAPRAAGADRAGRPGRPPRPARGRSRRSWPRRWSARSSAVALAPVLAPAARARGVAAGLPSPASSRPTPRSSAARRAGASAFVAALPDALDMLAVGAASGRDPASGWPRSPGWHQRPAGRRARPDGRRGRVRPPAARRDRARCAAGSPAPRSARWPRRSSARAIYGSPLADQLHAAGDRAAPRRAAPDRGARRPRGAEDPARRRPGPRAVGPAGDRRRDRRPLRCAFRSVLTTRLAPMAASADR